jgi:hypothetical protein
LKATGVTKDEQKRALLLHVTGEEVQDIIETLDNTGTKRRSKFPAIFKKLSKNCRN